MAQLTSCPECGAAVADDSPQGMCRKCLLLAALGESSGESRVTLDSGPPSPPAGSDRVRYFGDYELLGEVARGGMGIVYKARQISLNRMVAVKMILAGRLARQEDVRRFHIEAEAAANLQHPNIVAIHEIGEHEGQHYFSMEFVEGRSLAAAVQEGPIPPCRAAGYVKTIAETIEYAHQQGTLHRDLKPSNILIDEQDQPRITDFGLAKRLDSSPDLTASSTVLGTPSYVAPEQAAARREELGPASDVYSLGAILYELLTGVPPFCAATPLDTLLLVLETEPVAPRRLRRKIPRQLEQICLKCLRKDPARRYRSAQHLADDLERFLLGEPTLAVREIRGRTKRWMYGCGLAMLLAGVALAWGVLKLVPLGFDLYQHEMSEQQQFLALAGQWQPPPEGATPEQLFPQRVGAFTLAGHAEQAGIPELRIYLPGHLATYEARSQAMELFLCRAPRNEWELIVRRIEDLFEDETTERTPYYRYGPSDTRRGSTAITRFGFTYSEPRESVAMLWCADWLMLARTTGQSEPEAFLKDYLLSMRPSGLPPRSDNALDNLSTEEGEP